MKRLILLIITILALCGCAAQAPEAASTPEPTANPYLVWAGEWTGETGDGSEVWYLLEDGRVRLPALSPDGYRTIGGYGSWTVGETLTVQVGDTLTLQPVSEDGLEKLYCPELNKLLVRTGEREAAYGAKFLEVQVTADTVKDYIYFEKVPAPTDESGQRIWKEVFVLRSSLYEQGWLYWGEREVDLDFRYWDSYHLDAEKMPFGVSFYVQNFNEIKASGTLVFIKADHVTEQQYDGDVRRLVCCSGEVWEEWFETHRYGEYVY